MKILVESEEEKQTLIKESEYIHDLFHIDTDQCPTLTHIYNMPDECWLIRAAAQEDIWEDMLYDAGYGPTVLKSLDEKHKGAVNEKLNSR